MKSFLFSFLLIISSAVLAAPKCWDGGTTSMQQRAMNKDGNQCYERTVTCMELHCDNGAVYRTGYCSYTEFKAYSGACRDTFWNKPVQGSGASLGTASEAKGKFLFAQEEGKYIELIPQASEATVDGNAISAPAIAPKDGEKFSVDLTLTPDK